MPAKMPDNEGRRHAMGFRTTLATKESIEEAARQSGRSISQEIEARLEHSFAMDRYEENLRKSPISQAIDKETEAMIEGMKSAAGAAMMYAGESWKNDVYTRASVRAAIIRVMSTSFSDHSLGAKPEDIDFARVKQADDIGNLIGRVLFASSKNPEVAAWITDLANKARGPEDRPLLGKGEPDRNAQALRELLGQEG